MQEKNTNINSPIINLLVQPRFRVLRHLVLFILIVSVSLGFIWHMVEDGIVMTPIQKYGGVLLFTSVFLGGCYLNIYVLTPCLLLKNKWLSYFCCLLAIVAFVITSIVLFEEIFYKEDLPQSLKSHEEANYMIGFVNILSSFLSIFLLFAGTTTFVIFSHWAQDMRRAEALQSTTVQLELELLENQINPHFLFNMLNNANIMIKTNPDMAKHIIVRLEEMLRYQMDGSSREKVQLKDDISFLNDFLELEKIRRDFFDYTISTEGNAENIQIPPLLFITFVENAVKHNTDSRAASYVHILFKVTEVSLIFICENSIPDKPFSKQTGGIGLTNIKRRLELLYGNNYLLEQNKTDTKYTVKLELKL